MKANAVADSFCVDKGLTRPDGSSVCNAQACPSYIWVARDWEGCSALCGGGTQTRAIDCVLNGEPSALSPACAQVLIVDCLPLCVVRPAAQARRRLWTRLSAAAPGRSRRTSRAATRPCARSTCGRPRTGPSARSPAAPAPAPDPSPASPRTVRTRVSMRVLLCCLLRLAFIRSLCAGCPWSSGSSVET